jgi:hypothetical protein
MATEVKNNDSLDPNFLILAGFIFKDMENIEKYGMSSLTGNVIHFIVQTLNIPIMPTSRALLVMSAQD